MILALVCACQLLAARGELLVRDGADLEKIQLVSMKGAPFIAWKALQTTFGAQLSTLPNGRAIVSVAGVRFELAHGVPFVRVGDKIVPLAAGPRITGDSSAVPLQLIAQVLPRFAPAVKYSSTGRTVTLNAVAAVASGTAAATKGGAGAAAGVVRRRIVVDAGHGGPDDGTSVVTAAGVKVAEKSITLGVATYLGEELRRRNFDVTFTRTRDTLIALQDRGRIANASEGHAFLSIHVNSAGAGATKSPRGVETYFLSAARTEDAKRVQAIENAAAQFESPDGGTTRDDPLAYILSDMKQNEHLRESSELAARIQSSLSKAHPGGSRGVRQAEFAVLVGSFMPSVLVEIGFLSNQSDASFLVKKENQRKIAVALADAMATYFKGYDRRVVANGDGR